MVKGLCGARSQLLEAGLLSVTLEAVFSVLSSSTVSKSGRDQRGLS